MSRLCETAVQNSMKDNIMEKNVRKSKCSFFTEHNLDFDFDWG